MATTTSPLRSVDPTTGELREVFELLTGVELDGALDAARSGFARWRWTPIEERGAVVGAAAGRLRARRDELAAAITGEMGKPVAEAEAEVDKCAFACEHYAARAASMLADQPAPSDSPASYLAHRPLGVVLACMPWNFPLWQVFRFAAPGLMAGNAAVLKHSPQTYRCALLIEEVLGEAGLPAGVFQTLRIDGDGAQRVIADPRVDAVTFTGSDRVGALVAESAGRHVKKTVLELGGSDAFIVLDDADVAAAAATAVRSRFQNCGQSCIAAKRFIVVERVAEEFEARMIEGAAALRVGDPRSRDTEMGPMARHDLCERIASQLAASLAGGARLRLGGEPGEGPGAFHAATVIDGCDAETTAFREETFGPLAAIARVADAEAAIELANRSPFGLGGNLWTGDLDRARALAARLESGGVFINGMTHSDPRLPFGGVRRSGYGRELHEPGIREFTNLQTVWLPPPG